MMLKEQCVLQHCIMCYLAPLVIRQDPGTEGAPIWKFSFKSQILMPINKPVFNLMGSREGGSILPFFL